jgi:hypothetical protein
MFYQILILFTLIAALLLICLFTAAMLDLTFMFLDRRKEGTRKFSKIVLISAGGFGTCIAILWLFVIVPSGWKLPFWETFYAGFRSDIYGHVVEHAAEQYALFMLFIGDLGAVAAGTAGFIIGRHRLRPVDLA